MAYHVPEWKAVMPAEPEVDGSLAGDMRGLLTNNTVLQLKSFTDKEQTKTDA